MTGLSPGKPWRALALAAGAVLALPAAGVAQGGPGFLFRRPMVRLELQGGWAIPMANSEVFDFTRNQLTVGRTDFQTPVIGGGISLRLSERLDLRVSSEFSRSSTRSEFRDWVDQDDLPIEQTTIFQRVPLTVDLKVYLRERGRSVSRFAWIPTRWAPYVGAGVGAVWYRFEQTGDFVDFQTLDVFSDTFLSEGRAGTAHAFAGVDYSFTPQLVFTGEGRYSWGKADMSADFVDFNQIDLSGFQVTLGLAVRF